MPGGAAKLRSKEMNAGAVPALLPAGHRRVMSSLNRSISVPALSLMVPRTATCAELRCVLESVRTSSPFLTSLQDAVSESKKSQKPSNDGDYKGTSTLQCIAGNRGKVAPQRAPKHAPDETPMPRLPSSAWRTMAAGALFGDSRDSLTPSMRWPFLES